MHDIRAALKRAHPNDLPKIYLYIHWVSLKRSVKRRLYIHSYLFRRHYRRDFIHAFLFLFIAAPLFGSDRYIFMQYYTLLFCVITAAALKRFIG